MMKKVKPLLVFFIVVLIFSPNSLGQPSAAIGKGIIPNEVPVTNGIISGNAGAYPIGEFSNANVDPRGFVDDGSGVYPAGEFSNAKVYLGRITSDVNISRREFLCFLMSSCGIYPRGIGDNSDGTKVYLDGVSRMVSPVNTDAWLCVLAEYVVNLSLIRYLPSTYSATPDIGFFNEWDS
jgi:hypothetical protein